MDLKHIIDQKDHYADYMVDEITHICRDFEKREPGSKGEQQACEYMAQVLKKDCGCQRADVESFKENPGSFFGWIYFTITFVLAAIVCFFFCPASLRRCTASQPLHYGRSFPGSSGQPAFCTDQTA